MHKDLHKQRTGTVRRWMVCILFGLAAPCAHAQIVINEIHFDPADKTSFEEFIELHNTAGTPVDISGWSLGDAVAYTFPPGTAIPADGYVVVAQDPATLDPLYGVTSLGPWLGSLNNDGETIELSDAANLKVDEVDYQLGFPWPTVGDAPGYSIELLNPAFDNDLGGNWRSSFTGDPLSPSTQGPTPGAINAVYTNNAPPQIRQVDHSPSRPIAGEAVMITAKISDPEGVADAQLHYQIVDPGSYIALDDAAYETSWTTVTMYDDGTNGDAMAGDSVYSAVLDAATQQHRRLVRYRITASDNAAATITVPYNDDPQPNFAYFCYDGIPSWEAAIQPGTSPVLTFDTNVMRRLPAVHLISRNYDVEQATWFSEYSGDAYLWNGTLVYDGKVYDHIRYRARGGVWRYAMVKNMWKFDFNRGHDLQMRDDYGKKYGTRWTKLNLGACIQQRNYWHRGEQGMFESVGSRLFNLAGVPSFNTSFLQLRVIDDADESTANQYAGDFWGLYLAVEQLDGRFLDEHDLPDGNFYKMESGTGELNNLGPWGPTDKSDLNYILANYNGASDAWWESNWNLDGYYSYQTIVQAIHHYDISYGKNYFYYHNPETDIWSIIPWDLDLTWADNMFDSTAGGVDALADRVLDAASGGSFLILPGFARTTFRIAFRNRVREIRDLLFNADQTGQLIDEKAGLLRDLGTSPSFLDADRAMWDYNPKMNNPTYSTSLEKAGTGEFYQWSEEPGVSNSFEGCIQLMKDYVNYRAVVLDTLSSDADIPDTPTLTYVGTAGYPVNGLAFETSIFSDPQGLGTFDAMEWRIGEILDPSAPAYDPAKEPPYEIESKWESGELAGFNDTVTIPPDALKVGHTYRARIRMKDTSGRWSHWSAPLEFTTGEPSTAADMVNYLRISELMYDPPAGSDYEFIELHNTCTGMAIDVSGAAFTDGIDFNFPDGSSIAPNGYLLLIGTTNEAAFRSGYGLSTNASIAGTFAGSLANGGEELTLKTAPGGTIIAEFDYGSSRHWPLGAAGAGHSLIPLTTEGQATGALDYPGNWRDSAYIGGSPDSPDPQPPTGNLVLNEIAAHTDFSSPYFPDYDSDDWIEIHNRSASSVSLDGWYLSDDPKEPDKWACPAVSVPAGGFIVFNEVDYFHNPITTGFGLDKAGEQVLLSCLPGTASNRVVDAVGFKGQENNRSFNRHGGYWFASVTSSGSTNSAPFDGLRIGEIMYWPAPLGTNDNLRDEFIELYNPTASNITMQTDSEAWRIDGGVEYTFPDNTVVPAGSTLLVVSFDPADTATSNAFTTAYSITNSVTLFGPWEGKLGNRSERVSLERPQAPDFPGDNYSWVVEDETVYGNQPPWPTHAAGSGSALARVLFNESGLDPANWLAGPPTPGSSNPSPFADQDGDGQSDYDESIFGTDPFNPASRFIFDTAGGSNLWWIAVSGRTYSIYWTDDLTLPFVPIATGLPHPQSNYTDSAHAAHPQGFYRIGVEIQ